MRGILPWRVLPSLSGLAILCVVALLPVTVPITDEIAIPPPLTTTNPAKGTPRPLGPLYANMIATQQFLATGGQIHSVALFLATYARTNHGTAQVIVQTSTDGQWHNLATRTIEKETLRDNAFYTVTFSPPLAVEPGQPVRIMLQSSDRSGDAIAWWTNPTWKPAGYALTLNDRPWEGTARFEVRYVPIAGRLFQVLGPVWQRMTVFLNPFWQITLAIGLVILVGSLFVIGQALVR